MKVYKDLCLCPQELRQIVKEKDGLITWVCPLCESEYTCSVEAFNRRREG